MVNEREWIGITMGCPVGIGPEICLQLFSAGEHATARYQPVVIGDLNVLRACASQLRIAVELEEWRPGTASRPGVVPVCHVPAFFDPAVYLEPKRLAWGQPDARTGAAMAAYVQCAFQLIQTGALAAMVTCPITKAALQAAGYDHPGHTEMLAALCQTTDYAMMMAGRTLRVTLVTIHQGLAKVAAALSIEEIVKLIRLSGRALQVDFAVAAPRIAVAGFNPHASEGGLFGSEEAAIISPAVAQARAEGWLVSGPYPPDTVFHRAVQGNFDVVICMYHDQGLIPFKLLHFADGVNVTLGLPIVRTSVDHGTAYDIAGKGVAGTASLAAAFALAGQMVDNRKRYYRDESCHD